MFVVTGATGQLGRLVINELLRVCPANRIVAAVRNVEKASDLAASGVTVRYADYGKPDTLVDAMAGATRVLLISGSEVGQREAQHQAVIDAARAQGVELLAYTSILRGPASSLKLAQEHIVTEKALAQSGVPHVILRNSWYSENYTGSIGVNLQFGVVMGCSGNGRVAPATRADYAAAAAVVLTAADQSGKIYELAGDESFSMGEFAALLSELSGKPVAYQDMSEAEYAKALVQAGLPEAFARILADSSAGMGRGDLFDDSRQLSGLIKRPTTPVRELISSVLAQLS